MAGGLHTVYFFGYSLAFAVGLGLTCGSVAYVWWAVFVHVIYQRLMKNA